MSHSSFPTPELHLLPSTPQINSHVLFLHVALGLASTISCLDYSKRSLLPVLSLSNSSCLLKLEGSFWMDTWPPYYAQGTKISVKLPIAMERRSRVLLGLPRHLGTWALFSLLVLPLLPLFISQVRLHPDRTTSFPPGTRSCLDAQGMTTSDKVLVVRGMTVWGVQQVGTRGPQ